MPTATTARPSSRTRTTTTPKRSGSRPSARPPAPKPRGQIIAKNADTYLVRAYVGRLPDGRRKYASKQLTGTHRDAARELTRLQREVDTGTWVEPCRVTVAEYLTGWLDSRCRIAPRTLTDYRALVARHVVPTLGAVRLDKLTRADVQHLVASLVRAELSPRSVRYVFGVLKHALKDAVVGELLFRNPAEHVELPRIARREMQALTAEQVHRFLAGTKDDALHALWAVLLHTGLRPGEAFALSWDDVDGGTLRVVRALKKGADDTFTVGAPKTENGRRVVHLPAVAVEALREHRARQAREILAAGRKYHRDGLIFGNAVGRPLDIAKVRREFKAALERCGLPPVRLYDSRHTHASLALAAGMDSLVLSRRLGHAHISQTLGTYTHVMPGQQEAAVDRYAAYMARAAS